jgi:hypothetical protein
VFKLAQKLLGHSNLSTTAEIYAHTSTDGVEKQHVRLSGKVLEFVLVVPHFRNNYPKLNAQRYEVACAGCESHSTLFSNVGLGA